MTAKLLGDSGGSSPCQFREMIWAQKIQSPGAWRLQAKDVLQTFLTRISEYEIVGPVRWITKSTLRVPTGMPAKV